MEALIHGRVGLCTVSRPGATGAVDLCAPLPGVEPGFVSLSIIGTRGGVRFLAL